MDDIGIDDLEEKNERESDAQSFGPSAFIVNSDRACSRDNLNVGNQDCLARQERVPNLKDL